MKLFSIKKSALIWISQLLVALMIISLIPLNTNVSASEDLEALLTEELASSKSRQLDLADSRQQIDQAPQAGEEAAGLRINTAEDDPADPGNDQGGLSINTPGSLTVSLFLDDQEPDSSAKFDFSVNLVYRGPKSQMLPQGNDQNQDPDSGPSGREDLEESMEGLSTGLRINKNTDDNSDQDFNETIEFSLIHEGDNLVKRNDGSDLPAGTEYIISVTLPKDYVITRVEGVDNAPESSLLSQAGMSLNLAQTESQHGEGMESLDPATRTRELDGSNDLTQAGSIQGIIGSGQSSQVIVHAEKIAWGWIEVSKDVEGDGADPEAEYAFILEHDSKKMRDVDGAPENPGQLRPDRVRDQDIIPEGQEAPERLVLLQSNRLNSAISDDERGSGRPINSGQEGGDDATGLSIGRQKIEFRLRDGETYEIELPAGTGFTLYEVDESNLKDIQMEEALEREDNKVHGTIIDGNTLQVTFINEVMSLTGRPGQGEDGPGPDQEGPVSNPAEQEDGSADILETGHAEGKVDEEDMNPKIPEPQGEIQLDLVAGDAEEGDQAEGLEAPVTGEGTSFYLVLALLMTLLSLAGLLLARRPGRGEEA